MTDYLYMPNLTREQFEALTPDERWAIYCYSGMRLSGVFGKPREPGKSFLETFVPPETFAEELWDMYSNYIDASYHDEFIYRHNLIYMVPLDKRRNERRAFQEWIADVLK